MESRNFSRLLKLQGKNTKSEHVSVSNVYVMVNGVFLILFQRLPPGARTRPGAARKDSARREGRLDESADEGPCSRPRE